MKRMPSWQGRPRDANGFSDVEAAVLRLMCLGLSNREIGEQIERTERYVKLVRGELMNITSTKNGPHLAVWAVLNGYGPSAEAFAARVPKLSNQAAAHEALSV